MIGRYLRSWFVLDVASTVPFAAIMVIFTHKYETGFVTSFVNLLRLWRLRRVSDVFARYFKETKESIEALHFARLPKSIIV